MCNAREMQRLMDLLLSQSILIQRGFSFAMENAEELIAFRGPHMRGIWRCERGEYAWTPAGYGTPTHTVRNIEAALRYTLVALATAP